MATAIINTKALQHNFAQVKGFAPKSKVLAMIKADAYGHGAVAVAKALVDADGFGVARLSEALALRQAGISNRIVIMGSVNNIEEMLQAVEANVEIMVHQSEHLDWLEQLTPAAPIPVWLKLDTGMHRLGFSGAAAEQAYARLMANASVVKPFVAVSHFAAADAKVSSVTKAQLEAHFQMTEGWAVQHSLANSPAILNYPESHQDWVRPGIMLYGVSSIENTTGQDFGLQPVMSFRAQVIAINRYAAGDRIGYGGTYCCDKPTRVAVVNVGYGDGYPRHAVSGTKVLLNDRIGKLVGRVSMDTISIDIGQNPLALGDEVVLWGEGAPVEQLADAATTIGHDIVVGLTSRVAKIYAK